MVYAKFRQIGKYKGLQYSFLETNCKLKMLHSALDKTKNQGSTRQHSNFIMMQDRDGKDVSRLIISTWYLSSTIEIIFYCFIYSRHRKQKHLQQEVPNQVTQYVFSIFGQVSSDLTMWFQPLHIYPCSRTKRNSTHNLWLKSFRIVKNDCNVFKMLNKHLLVSFTSFL